MFVLSDFFTCNKPNDMYLMKPYEITAWFVLLYIEAVYCFICVRRRGAVGRYRMISLVLLMTKWLQHEMRIWSIFLIESDFKWCIHLSTSLFLYWNSYILYKSHQGKSRIKLSRPFRMRTFPLCHFHRICMSICHKASVCQCPFKHLREVKICTLSYDLKSQNI